MALPISNGMDDTLFYGTSFGTVVGIILFTSQQNTYGIVAGVFICLVCILFLGKFSKKVFQMSYTKTNKFRKE